LDASLVGTLLAESSDLASNAAQLAVELGQATTSTVRELGSRDDALAQELALSLEHLLLVHETHELILRNALSTLGSELLLDAGNLGTELAELSAGNVAQTSGTNAAALSTGKAEQSTEASLVLGLSSLEGSLERANLRAELAELVADASRELGLGQRLADGAEASAGSNQTLTDSLNDIRSSIALESASQLGSEAINLAFELSSLATSAENSAQSTALEANLALLSASNLLLELVELLLRSVLALELEVLGVELVELLVELVNALLGSLEAELDVDDTTSGSDGTLGISTLLEAVDTSLETSNLSGIEETSSLLLLELAGKAASTALETLGGSGSTASTTAGLELSLLGSEASLGTVELSEQLGTDSVITRGLSISELSLELGELGGRRRIWISALRSWMRARSLRARRLKARRRARIRSASSSLALESWRRRSRMRR